jgi:thioesterase domain-containing protein/acetyltransferase-like isoleucine patch superfamily enzyme
MVTSQAIELGVDGDSRVLQFASMSFDASVWEIWMALLSGGRLMILPEAERAAGTRLPDFLRAKEITHATLPPAVLVAADFDDDFAGVTLVTAGEACTPAVAAAASRFGRAVNAYGPTEATVCATMHRIGPANGVVPIGRPLVNVQAFVLDPMLRPVPPGVAGELYLAGSGLARGYLGQPVLTAERFIANPFSGKGERLYRTGDLASWSNDGELVFLGRADDQVKIRGFRIEPGEIESVIATHPQVSQVAVIAHEDAAAGARLVAYVVPGPAGIDTAQVRQHAANTLPEHMVPAMVIVLDALPLTVSGKIDRRALPSPEVVTEPAGPEQSLDSRTEVLRRLFAQALGLDGIGADESFFERGGHSLLAVRLISRIRALLGAEISIKTLFDAPTAAGLAARLDDTPTDQFANVIELRRSKGPGRPVFCIHPIGGLAWCYSAVLPYLDRGQSVYGIQATESHGKFRAVASMAELVDRYADLIRSTHADGPYVILGWSLGGVLAYEVATRIEQSGGRVDLVAMFDSTPYDQGHWWAESEDEFTKWVAGEVLGSGSADGVIDNRQQRALIRAAKAIASVLGPSTTDGYRGRVLSIAASRSVETSGPREARWAPYLRDVVHHTVTAEHSTMMTPEVMKQAGPLLRAAVSARSTGAAEPSRPWLRPSADDLDIPDPGQPRPLGDDRVVFIRPALSPTGAVVAGDYSYYDASEDVGGFEETRVRYASGTERLRIGRFCSIAAGVTFLMAGANHLYDGPTAFPFLNFPGDWQDAVLDSLIERGAPAKADTVIGNDVWIGRDATILPGVTIADGAIVGARAVVASDVGPYQIVVGNPARVVRIRYEPDQVRMLLAAQWWNWPVAVISRHLRELVRAGPEELLAIAETEGLVGHANEQK